MKEIVPCAEAIKPPVLPLTIFSKSIHLRCETEVNKLVKLSL